MSINKGIASKLPCKKDHKLPNNMGEDNSGVLTFIIYVFTSHGNTKIIQRRDRSG